MMARFFAPLLLLIWVAGCQTGADTDEALKSAAVAENEDSSAKIEASQSDVEVVPTPGDEPTEVAKPEAAQSTEQKPETAAKPTADKPTKAKSTGGDPIAIGAAKIGTLRKSKGEKAAVEAVFACYKKAQQKSASLQAAQVCAAQDFALSRDIISRRKANASGTGDRALLVSKRHAARIGALMQLKGMGQSQFNTFGKYLHAVAEPAYKKAISS